MYKTPRRSQKAQKTPNPTPKSPTTVTDGPCAHVGKQHATPAVNKVQAETCCLIRSCSRPGIRTMKELILTLAIHDKNVTMAKAAQVSLIIRTGPTPPSEDSGAAKTHRNDELGITVLSKQRFVIAVPTNTRPPFPLKVKVRGSRHLSLSTPRLHQGSDSPPNTS